MMKTINVSFDNIEFREVMKKKGNQTWKGFILGLISKEELLKREKEEDLIQQIMAKGVFRAEAVDLLEKERVRIKEEDSEKDKEILNEILG